MRAGIVVAVETGALRRVFGDALEKKRMGGFRVYVYRIGELEIYAIAGCAGELAAAAGTQALISEAGVDLIINAGVAGGLHGSMLPGTLVVVDNVVHYDFDVTGAGGAGRGCYPFLPGPYIPVSEDLAAAALEALEGSVKGICASGDRFVGTASEKAELRKLFLADICEMEAAGVAMTCMRNRVPVLILKTVSDGHEGGAAECGANFTPSSDQVMNAVHKIITLDKV